MPGTVILGAAAHAGRQLGGLPSLHPIDLGAIAIKAGIQEEVSSETINKVCASGIRAAGPIDAAVRSGDLDMVSASRSRLEQRVAPVDPRVGAPAPRGPA